jgi:hypothetical protein
VVFFICFVVFSTRASSVGIPRDIYRIYLYITILCIFICTIVFLHLLLLLPVRFILRQEWLRLVTYRLFLQHAKDVVD